MKTFEMDLNDPEHHRRHSIQDPLAGAMSHLVCEECCKHRVSLKGYAADFWLMIAGVTNCENESELLKTDDIVLSEEQLTTMERILTEAIDAYGTKSGRPVHVHHEGRYYPVKEWFETDMHKMEVCRQLAMKRLALLDRDLI